MMPRTEQRASYRYRNYEGQAYISFLLSRHLVTTKFHGLRKEYQDNLEMVFSFLMGNRGKGFNDFLMKLVPSFKECLYYDGKLPSSLFTFAIRTARNIKNMSTWSKRREYFFEDLQNSFVSCFDTYERNPEDEFTIQVFSVPFTKAFIHMLLQMKEDYHFDFGLIHQFLPFILAYQQHFHYLAHACEKLGYYKTVNTEDKICLLLAYEDPAKNIFVYGFNNHNVFECCGRLKPNGHIDYNFTAPSKTFHLVLQCADATDFQISAFALWGGPIPAPAAIPEDLQEYVDDDDDNYSLGLFVASPGNSIATEDPHIIMAANLFLIVDVNDLAAELRQSIVDLSALDRRSAIFGKHSDEIAEAIGQELERCLLQFTEVAQGICNEDERVGVQITMLDDLLVFSQDPTVEFTATYDGCEADWSDLIEMANAVHDELKTRHFIEDAHWVLAQSFSSEGIREAANRYLASNPATSASSALPDVGKSINCALDYVRGKNEALADRLRAQFTHSEQQVANCIAVANRCSPRHYHHSGGARMQDDEEA